MGYTQVSWDNKSGKEEQPSSMEKDWDELAYREKLAAIVLGYNRKMWNRGKKLPPAMEKHWAELSTCGDVHVCEAFSRHVTSSFAQCSAALSHLVGSPPH